MHIGKRLKIINMNKLNPIALANTLALIDIILHPLFHIWVSLAPDSYEWLMNLFVAGLKLEVTGFDSDIYHILTGTIIEAVMFWALGFAGAIIYNKMLTREK